MGKWKKLFLSGLLGGALLLGSSAAFAATGTKMRMGPAGDSLQ